ncbi:hypothetical protein [Ilumatobacter sp.]|uniref:hypothetical protein n=1 Tax=Ilumatobacter sp. TaxID=1967498 RepID=UPI003AF9AC97
MPFVNKSGADGEEERTDVAAGAPQPFDRDFDPNDPQQTKVHYNLTGWGFEQHAELSETLAERGVPHVWDGEELVVPEEIEAEVDALFDELEAEIGPFPVPLLEGDPSTEFGLDEWPLRDLETLKASLIEAEIPHLWHARTLHVAQDAEDVVDDLLDAIEAGDVASIDEDAEAPDGALHDLYGAADRLARDSTHSNARTSILDLVPQLSPTVPPFGIAAAAWSTIVARAQAVVEEFEEGADPEQVTAAADELRTACRPYV